MAVKKSIMIRDYWPHYRHRGLGITVLMQVAGTLAIGCALLAAGVVANDATFWIILFTIVITSISVNITLFNLLSAPLKDLTSALTHISGEPTIITPPNPNAPRFERDGFKPLLQLIYELASNDVPSQNQDDTNSTELTTALNNTAAGFVIFDADKKIVFANGKAPVHTNPEGNTVLDLIFEDEYDLASWLKECEETAVHAERTWQRVASKIIGEEGRKIYDITASYQKGSSAEVVVTLFDRTGLYLPEDEDLDFIAFAAHELRGPITVIRGYLDVLSDEL